MPSSPRRLRELAAQTRLWAQYERRIQGPAARLVARHMRAGAGGFALNGILGMSRALEGAGPEWFELLVPHYVDTGQKFGDRVMRSLGVKAARDQFTAALLDWVRSQGLSEAKGLADATEAQLRQLIAAGEIEGFSQAKIARDIAKATPTISRIRSRVIARTETHTAASYAGQEAARASGIGLRKVWLAHPTDRTRDTHLAADGQKRGLDEPYDVGGYALRFPGDSSLGAPAEEVIQCRCGELHEPMD